MNESKAIEQLVPFTLGKKSWFHSILHSSDWVWLFAELTLVGFMLALIISYLQGYADPENVTYYLMVAVPAGLVIFLIRTFIVCHKNAFFVEVNSDRIRVLYQLFGYYTTNVVRMSDIERVQIRERPNFFLFRFHFDSIEYVEILKTEAQCEEDQVIRFPYFQYASNGVNVLLLLPFVFRKLAPDADLSGMTSVYIPKQYQDAFDDESIEEYEQLLEEQLIQQKNQQHRQVNEVVRPLREVQIMGDKK